ncbi:hypothetical protein EDC01DRAFT_125390 [Geopyxis carbonaria]|nr:hypothetical protein EDC01DRAFT_125390 [Geopyxis carbonaria]
MPPCTYNQTINNHYRLAGHRHAVSIARPPADGPTGENGANPMWHTYGSISNVGNCSSRGNDNREYRIRATMKSRSSTPSSLPSTASRTKRKGGWTGLWSSICYSPSLSSVVYTTSYVSGQGKALPADVPCFPVDGSSLANYNARHILSFILFYYSFILCLIPCRFLGAYVGARGLQCLGVKSMSSPGSMDPGSKIYSYNLAS